MNKLTYAAARALPGLVVASLLTAACQSTEPPAAQAPAAPSPKLPVDVQVVHARPYDAHETVVGTVAPHRQVEVVSEVARKVTRVAFQNGAFVRQGQLLYQLDDTDLRARVRRARAALHLAQLDEARFAELLKTQAARQQEYDQAFTALQAQRAELAVLEAELAKTEIRAPFAGQVGISQVYEGAFVAPGAVLTRLQDVSQVKVRFAVPEQYAAVITAGTRVRFSTGLGGAARTAVVSATEPDVNAADRSLLVEAVAANPGQRLRAGLSAEVAYPTLPGGQQAITVPSEALVPAASGYSVFAVRQGKATARAVTVQSRDEQRARLSAGLQAGDTILVSNILRAMDGTPVKIVGVQAPAATL